MNVYLDNAATTPLDKEVLAAMMPFLSDHFGNPSSSHAFGRKTKTAIEQSRRTIAKVELLLQVRSISQVVAPKQTIWRCTLLSMIWVAQHIITSPLNTAQSSKLLKKWLIAVKSN
jgi:cysteine sulfinate desulfinase/cysteine desulfurase-like protein